MSYIGYSHATHHVAPPFIREVLAPDGSATYFDLGNDVPGYQEDNIMVMVNNVVQEPLVSYSIINDATNRPRRLDFAGVALASTDNLYVVHKGTGTLNITPATGSVTKAALADNLVSHVVNKFLGSEASGNTLTLTEAPTNADSISVYINGVYQRSVTNYTVSGSTLIFTSALSAADQIDVHHHTIRGTVTKVPDGYVGTTQLADLGVTTAKIADSTGAADGVTAGKIASAAVTTAKIADSTGAADGVTSAKLATNAVTIAKLATDTGISATHHKIPSVTTTERDALTAAVGMIIYNSTIGILQQYAASGWASIDSPPTVSSLDYPGDDTALDIVGEFNLTGCTTVIGDATITHPSATNLKQGMAISGTGIPASATVLTITDNTHFELSADATAAGSANVTLTCNTQTLIIAGTNFSSGATVAIDGTVPSIVTRNSSTQLTVTGTPAKTAGTKVDGLVVTNTSGLSGSINVDYSPLPGWSSPASGNILNAFNGLITEIALTGGADTTSYAITTGALPTGLTIGSGDGDINGTMNASAATYNFTVSAIDAQAQSSPRLFNIISKGSYPTGGIIIEPGAYTGNYRSHTFLIGNTGEYFTSSSVFNIDYLVIGGGGGGGSQTSRSGGGGGAGGFRTGTGLSLPAGAYQITVGDGGTAASNDHGLVGGTSTFHTITAAGGGGGSGDGAGTRNGASGGGGMHGGTPGGTGIYDAGQALGHVLHQGRAGGDGVGESTFNGGGGGGASAVGGVSSGSAAGAGGAGTSNNYRDGSSGSTVGLHIFAGGGGGGGGTSGTGGSGGGGAGGAVSPAGTAGTDDGGGGGGGARTQGGGGGSGIVIIRYAI